MRQSDKHKASPLLPTAQEYLAWHIPLVLATPSVASFRAPFFSTHLAAALSCHHHHHHEDPHVQPGDQDAHVPVPGVANVVLRVELVAVGAEGVEQLVPITIMTLELLRPLDF